MIASPNLPNQTPTLKKEPSISLVDVNS